MLTLNGRITKDKCLTVSVRCQSLYSFVSGYQMLQTSNMTWGSLILLLRIETSTSCVPKESVCLVVGASPTQPANRAALRDGTSCPDAETNEGGGLRNEPAATQLRSHLQSTKSTRGGGALGVNRVATHGQFVEFPMLYFLGQFLTAAANATTGPLFFHAEHRSCLTTLLFLCVSYHVEEATVMHKHGSKNTMSN